MRKQEQPKRPRRQWLQLIQQQLAVLKQNNFVFDENIYVSTKYRTAGLFVWRFLVTAGVLTYVGSMTERIGGVRKSVRDPNARQRILDVLNQAVENYRATPPHAPLRADPYLNRRGIYQLNPDLGDQIGHWSYWTQEDGGELVAVVDITRIATSKKLELQNPSGQKADHPWDRPDGEPDSEED